MEDSKLVDHHVDLTFKKILKDDNISYTSPGRRTAYVPLAFFPDGKPSSTFRIVIKAPEGQNPFADSDVTVPSDVSAEKIAAVKAHGESLAKRIEKLNAQIEANIQEVQALEEAFAKKQAEGPKAEEPDPPKPEEPKAEEPDPSKPEEPKAEEPDPPKPEGPKAEEPDPPKPEEPKAEEPKVDPKPEVVVPPSNKPKRVARNNRRAGRR